MSKLQTIINGKVVFFYYYGKSKRLPDSFLILGSCPMVDPSPHNFNLDLPPPTPQSSKSICFCNRDSQIIDLASSYRQFQCAYYLYSAYQYILSPEGSCKSRTKVVQIFLLMFYFCVRKRILDFQFTAGNLPF